MRGDMPVRCALRLIQTEIGCVEVIDTGPGIACENRERLLQPFERDDAARLLDRGIGFGLGLATSKAIVEAHDGLFVLTHTAGDGLTARIRLPSA